MVGIAQEGKLKKKINLKFKTLEINKITLENKRNKLGIEIYNIIQYEVTKQLCVHTATLTIPDQQFVHL